MVTFVDSVLPYVIVEWLPPVEQIVCRVLCHEAVELQYLVEAWQKRHMPLLAADEPHREPAQKMRLCFYAGFCLCGDVGQTRIDMAAAFAQYLRRALTEKDAEPRRLYELGLLVVLIRNHDMNIYSWWHVSHANLNSMRMDLAPLAPTTHQDLADYAAEFGRQCLDFNGGDSPHLGICNHSRFANPRLPTPSMQPSNEESEVWIPSSAAPAVLWLPVAVFAAGRGCARGGERGLTRIRRRVPSS
eukprot:8554075-Pyramimonas_sp.AAC.2